MGADGDKSAWRGILGRATHTDPRATVVRMPKKSFEQLAAGLQLALDDRDRHISELERLDNA